MPRLAQIQTAQLLLERPQLIEKKEFILSELQREGRKRQMIQTIFVLGIVLCFFIADSSARMSALLIVIIAFAGYWHYTPVTVIELKRELEETEGFLRMFEQRDEKLRKKQQREEKRNKASEKD